MKNIKCLLLSVFINSAIFAMEEGAKESGNDKDASKKYQPAPYIGGGKLGDKSTKRLPQNIWTKIAQLGINPFGKTEAEIFRVTDLMMYPKKSVGSGKEVSGKEEVSVKEIDLKKVSAQAGLRKALLALISEVGLKKGIKDYSYDQFKADIIDDILRKKIGDKYNDANDLMDIIINMKAYNWAKFYSSKNQISMKLIHHIRHEDLNPNKIETLLNLGADPNVSAGVDGNPQLSAIFLLSNLIRENYNAVAYLDIKYELQRTAKKEKENISNLSVALRLLLENEANPLLEVFPSSRGKTLEDAPLNTPYDLILAAIKNVENGVKYKYYSGSEDPEYALKYLYEMKKMMDEAIKKQKQDKNKKVITGKEGKEERK